MLIFEFPLFSGALHPVWLLVRSVLDGTLRHKIPIRCQRLVSQRALPSSEEPLPEQSGLINRFFSCP